MTDTRRNFLIRSMATVGALALARQASGLIVDHEEVAEELDRLTYQRRLWSGANFVTPHYRRPSSMELWMTDDRGCRVKMIHAHIMPGQAFNLQDIGLVTGDAGAIYASMSGILYSRESSVYAYTFGGKVQL